MAHKVRMDHIAALFLQKKWIKFQLYFILSVAVGLGVWNLLTVNPGINSEINSEINTKINTQNIQLSSIAENANEVRRAEIATIARLSATPHNKTNTRINTRYSAKRFEDNPAFKLFAYVHKLVSQPERQINRKIAEADQK